MQYEFEAELWIWDARKSDSWTFITLPPDVSDDLRAQAPTPASGFGSIPVEVRVGQTGWRTSVFPDKESGCFVLPIKAAVRRSERLSAGDVASVQVRLAD